MNNEFDTPRLYGTSDIMKDDIEPEVYVTYDEYYKLLEAYKIVCNKIDDAAEAIYGN